MKTRYLTLRYHLIYILKHAVVTEWAQWSRLNVAFMMGFAHANLDLKRETVVVVKRGIYHYVNREDI